MTPCKTLATVIQWGVSLFVLTGFLGTPSSAAPVPLPDWVKPIESSLPVLPPEVIAEVDEICAFWDRNADSFRYDSQIKAQKEANTRRFVELQDQAGQAMIWQYLKATSGPYGGRLDTLSRLGRDRDLAAWLLPIVRFRIEWLKQAIQDPRQKKYLDEVFYSVEIYDIESYLYQQGEFSDIENLNLLVKEASEQNFKSEFGLRMKALGEHRLLQEQVKAMQEARNRNGQQTGPYWQIAARSLISEGVFNADALETRPPAKNPGDGRNRPKPLGPRKPLPEIRTLAGFLQPWMMWPMWLLIIAVSAGLLRWVFRKPKHQS